MTNKKTSQEKPLRKAKLLSIRTPAAVKYGYGNIVGQTFKVTGNAYHGFMITLTDGSSRNLMHYNYESV